MGGRADVSSSSSSGDVQKIIGTRSRALLGHVMPPSRDRLSDMTQSHIPSPVFRVPWLLYSCAAYLLVAYLPSISFLFFFLLSFLFSFASDPGCYSNPSIQTYKQTKTNYYLSLQQ